ncbi:MAG: hypothetical protein HY887_04510 [Deltaproteobacteria bacterium]|nr:hypothetical protein [Deltaproteobacteria bacterium]
MFDIDQTFIFQIIGYFALLFLLNNFLYKPVIKVLTERKERTEGVHKKAASIDKEVADGLAAYEKRIKEAVVKGHEERGKLRSEAHGMEKEMLSKAGAEAVRETAAMRRSIEESKMTALEGLKAEASAFSRDIAEKLLERKTAVIFFAFIMPLLPIIASASSEEAGPGGSNMDMVWKIVNFAVLAAAVYFIWIKVLSPLLRERSADIEKSLADAAAAKEAADRKAAEYRAKLDALDMRLSGIAEEMRLEGEAEKAGILKEAEAAALRLKEQARLIAGQEVEKARIELRREAASLAVRMAEEILKREIKIDDHERLVKGNLDNIRLN